MEQSQGTPSGTPAANRWQSISGIERRIIGVLAEKAKTTPDIYPMSVNGICTGCNQKNNRSPLMQLEPEAVEEALDHLREIGAVGMVEGYGRVQKYRHYLYEWLGVDKVELAVMTELLLRGDQTVGDLRARAARMEPIADQAALRPVVEALKAKGLIISLTSEGRGHVVTHALYKPRELEALREKYAGGAGPGSSIQEEEAPSHVTSPSPAIQQRVAVAAPMPTPTGESAVAALQRELDSYRSQVLQFQADLEEMRQLHDSLAEEVRTLKDALGG